jgi:iron-sulfur cluster assembly accessory protein
MNTAIENEVVVSITENAAGEMKSMLAKEADAEKKCLRVYVEQGGCSGMQYGMVFDERRDGDVATTQHGVPVLVDAFSASHLRGTVIDFSDALTGGGFKITNPNAKQSCGCGKSFET